KYHLQLAERLHALSPAANPALAAELALHFELGRQTERAIVCWTLAAQHAVSHSAHRDAIRMLRRVRDLHPTPEREIPILASIGDAHYALGEMPLSPAAYQEAATRAARANLPAAEVDALLRLARPAGFFDPDRCLAACARAGQIAASCHDP